MVYIFTALYYEAHIFIKQFHLTKNGESNPFQQFYNETAGILLTVTGVGEIAAAAAVGSVCAVHKPTASDLLFNIGICAHTAKNEGIFLCNKIVEEATGRTFYPDMLYRHNFAEGTVVTGMRPYVSNEAAARTAANNTDETLYDMEAAAVYQTAVHSFGPHQMIFLKIVSDRGDLETVSKECAAALMEKYKSGIFDYIGQISAITQKINSSKEFLSREDEKRIETFCADLHCSKTMEVSMKQFIHYLILAEIDYVNVIRDMYDEKLLPCKDKREGKLWFEEFKRRLF